MNNEQQPSLLGLPGVAVPSSASPHGLREPRFDGETFDSEQDATRLGGQLLRVFNIMSDGIWRTLADIRIATCLVDSEAGISARLRDLRKKRFGGHTVERRRTAPESGLFEYRVIVSRQTEG